MPRISEFFGIVILMYWKDVKRHHTPHFHVRSSGEEAAVDFNGNILSGQLSPRAKRLVQEWTEERKNELTYAWSQAVVGKEVPWIAPIK